MLCDLLNAELALQMETKPFYARVVVRIDGGLVSEADFNLHPEAYISRTESTLMYKPRTDRPKFMQQGPFIVKPQESRPGMRYRYNSWEEFCVESEKNPILKHIRDWSFISKEYFDLAKTNIGVPILIGYDWIRYNNHLRELYTATYGVEPPPDMSLLTIGDEGRMSVFSYDEYNNQLYKNNIETKLSKNKKGDK